ncbi:cell division protein ZapA [Paramaledivibacter caminithermalis]|jgi:cell division protein ZapA|uniref:Cell division protein ZapA n=1 Tax=Paramaledivibacter caminithermalis (strain DSM 15212 / CIP 107654 / DViRD3) TaxID=1121301 RepID=A0A1M6PXW3_PARC5|nr:cell division protein ZapA [Paramaledivibacter caminithermalis]SHK12814.1 cell division protein ZapA [Paramaledivibacter caminithermalis DSM 15212]
MTNKNRVIVKILGQEYTMVSDEPREYMQKVANYVDDKMVEIAEKNKKFSTAMVAVLTALNIGDEYFKLADDYHKIKGEHGKPVEELEKAKELLSLSSMKMEKMEKEYEGLLEEYEEMQENFRKMEASYMELREEVNRLSYECNIKDNKLKKAEKINEDLKNKLMQSEIKLVQTKKELQEFIEAFDE